MDSLFSWSKFQSVASLEHNAKFCYKIIRINSPLQPFPLKIKAFCFYVEHKVYQLEAILNALTLKTGRQFIHCEPNFV